MYLYKTFVQSNTRKQNSTQWKDYNKDETVQFCNSDRLSNEEEKKNSISTTKKTHKSDSGISSNSFSAPQNKPFRRV